MLGFNKKMIRAMQLKNFTESTQKHYLFMVDKLIKYFERSPETIKSEEIKDFILYLQNDKKYALSTIRSHINCYKFLVNVALKRKRDPFDIEQRRRENKLPVVFSINEIRNILYCCRTLKSRTILMTAYSSGLRLGELTKLKINDIDSQRMVIRVEGGKGRKDRYTILSQTLLKQLRGYYKEFKPTSYLFYGRTRDVPLHIRVPYDMFKQALKRSKINKKVGIHSLRHCFGTHLLEAGVDLRTIQVLMGHKSITTTATYIKVSQKQIDLANTKLDLLKFYS